MLKEIISILVSIFGILMSIGHFFQAGKIIKNKKAKDVSLMTYLIFFIGSFIWLIYGVILKELPIVISFIIGVIGSFLVLVLYSRFR